MNHGSLPRLVHHEATINWFSPPVTAPAPPVAAAAGHHFALRPELRGAAEPGFLRALGVPWQQCLGGWSVTGG